MSRLPATLLLFAVLAPAHEIPAGVTVQMLLDATPPHARLILRVPLSSMRDIDYTAADLAPQLRLAATQWLAQPLELYAGGERLVPRLAAFRLSLPSQERTAACRREKPRMPVPGRRRPSSGSRPRSWVGSARSWSCWRRSS